MSENEYRRKLVEHNTAVQAALSATTEAVRVHLKRYHLDLYPLDWLRAEIASLEQLAQSGDPHPAAAPDAGEQKLEAFLLERTMSDPKLALPAHQERTEPTLHAWLVELRRLEDEVCSDKRVPESVAVAFSSFVHRCENDYAQVGAPARAAEWQPLLDRIASEWAIKAAMYAREQVVPRYGPDEAGTPYERGLMNRLSATYRDGYLAAIAAVREALPPCALTGNSETKK